MKKLLLVLSLFLVSFKSFAVSQVMVFYNESSEVAIQVINEFFIKNPKYKITSITVYLEKAFIVAYDDGKNHNL